MAKEIIVLWSILIFVAGCGAKNWYLNYGIAESDLGTDKAIIAAGKALSSGDSTDIKGAAHYLKTNQMTEKQASLLTGRIDNDTSDQTRRLISNSVAFHGHNKIAYPHIIEDLSSKNSRRREFTIRALATMGCDAQDSLPMLKVISTNDSRGHQKVARIAIREITLDCMAKNIKINGPQ